MNQQKELPKDLTDLQYLEISIQNITMLYQNAVKAIKQTNEFITQTKEDKKVCKCPNVVGGIEALLRNLDQQKLKINKDIKDLRHDLKHYSSIYKKIKRLDK